MLKVSCGSFRKVMLGWDLGGRTDFLSHLDERAEEITVVVTGGANDRIGCN